MDNTIIAARLQDINEGLTRQTGRKRFAYALVPPPSPADGGKPNAYKVMRKTEDQDWTDVATAVVTNADLTGQPVRQKLAFKVIAINKAGEGSPSNTIEVVL